MWIICTERSGLTGSEGDLVPDSGPVFSTSSKSYPLPVSNGVTDTDAPTPLSPIIVRKLHTVGGICVFRLIVVSKNPLFEFIIGLAEKSVSSFVLGKCLLVKMVSLLNNVSSDLFGHFEVFDWANDTPECSD